MRRVLYILLLLFMALPGKSMHVADSLENMGFDDFRNSIHEDFGSFREEIMEDYIDFVRNPWKLFEDEEPIPTPVIDPVPPVVAPDVVPDMTDVPPVPIEQLLPPIDLVPQPKPVEPIDVAPVEHDSHVDFVFFGTKARVRLDAGQRVELATVEENAIADALEKMASRKFDAVITDCLDIRERLALSDWAYIKMLEAMADKAYGGHSNSSVLFMAYVYMRSGYSMRLAIGGGKLYMLYSTVHIVYDKSYYMVDGCMYYCLDEHPSRMHICQASFPGESPLSLIIATSQKFDNNAGKERKISSKLHAGMDVTISVNRNLLDFFSSYPASMIGNNLLTRWAMCATAPMSEEVRAQLYPVLKNHIKGLDELEAANRLLGLVQTGLVYGYDNEVWGCDRAFFSEESLFYDCCDCEDRSILFTKLVTDLLGLDVAIVYVPGHLLAAVRFSGDVKGECIFVDGEKYILCEPTCTNGAPVGWVDLEDGISLQAIKISGRNE